MDHHHHLHPSSALHHPHFYGPADHSCHYQQEGAQTEGISRLLFKIPVTKTTVCVFVKKALTHTPFRKHLRMTLIYRNPNGPRPAPTERLWLPPGPVCGGGDAGSVLGDGPAVVRGSYRALHLPREQPEAGVRVLSPRRAAQVPGHPRAALHWPHDLHPDGLLCVHDLCAEGQSKNIEIYTHIHTSVITLKS